MSFETGQFSFNTKVELVNGTRGSAAKIQKVIVFLLILLEHPERKMNLYCYRNREHFKCNGVINYKKGLKYYKSSPLLAPWLQHVGKHAPLSLLTP